MNLAYMTRRVTFAAAHRYWKDDWPEERNRRVFGACANPHGHGHNYALEATVKGEIDSDTGFAVDLGTIDAVLLEAVVTVLDHQHINHAVPEFGPGGAIPTTENLLVWAWPRIVDRLPEGVGLHRLRLREDEDLYVDYYGGGPEEGGP
jgi:6-pyruvoyltetrahydropterin/6-carboxytetrahydropterin synthase